MAFASENALNRFGSKRTCRYPTLREWLRSVTARISGLGSAPNAAKAEWFRFLHLSLANRGYIDALTESAKVQSALQLVRTPVWANCRMRPSMKVDQSVRRGSGPHLWNRSTDPPRVRTFLGCTANVFAHPVQGGRSLLNSGHSICRLRKLRLFVIEFLTLNLCEADNRLHARPCLNRRPDCPCRDRQGHSWFECRSVANERFSATTN